MVRLKDRNRQIPGGLTFYLPATRWRPREHSSFQGIVEALEHHLAANPTVAARLGWPADRRFIEGKVDEYNAMLCQAQGWTDYIMAGGGQPARPFRAGAGAQAPGADPRTPRAGCCGRR
jgi:hypothetical protein